MDEAEKVRGLIAGIRDIGPVLASDDAIGDRERRIPRSSIEALESAGVFDILRPEEFGGQGLGARALSDVAREIAHYSPSASWITVISNGSLNVACRFPEAAVVEIFADGSSSTVKMASVLSSGPTCSAVRSGAGYVINGSWPYASNAYDSDWAVVSLPLIGGDHDGNERGFALLSQEEFSVLDSWDTAGMRGTGSHTIVVDGALVPADRIASSAQILAEESESDATAPFGSRLALMSLLSATIAVPALGGAGLLLDLVVDTAHTKGVAGTTYRERSESGSFVRDIGATATKIEAAVLLQQSAADTIDRFADQARRMDASDRTRIRGMLGRSGQIAVEAASELMFLSGSSAFALANPMQRVWRDINVAASHAANSPSATSELRGDALLGVPYISPIL